MAEFEFTNKLLKEAIADAEAVRQTAIENDPKIYKETKENIQDSFNSNSDNKIMIVKVIEKAKMAGEGASLICLKRILEKLENKNGVFINLTYVDSSILDKVYKYLSHVNKQEDQLNEIEKEKEKIVTSFFK